MNVYVTEACAKKVLRPLKALHQQKFIGHRRMQQRYKYLLHLSCS